MHNDATLIIFHTYELSTVFTVKQIPLVYTELIGAEMQFAWVDSSVF